MFFKKNKPIKKENGFFITAETRDLDLFVISIRTDCVDKKTDNLSIIEKFNFFIKTRIVYLNSSNELIKFYSLLEKEFLFEGFKVETVSLSETRLESADKFPLAGPKYNRLRFGIDIKDNIHIT